MTGKTQRCLLCHGQLEADQRDYHPKCSKSFFQSKSTPLLPYDLNALSELARQVVRSRITVPGVQAKLSLNLERPRQGRTRLTLVGLWGNFILKPPMLDYPEMPETEDATMHLASQFKIDTVPHGLVRLKSGELAYITRRIDRQRDGRKLHMEDMCQLTERLTEDKYRSSMEQVGKAIVRFSSNPFLDAIKFFEMTLFTFLTGNADMHLKNFSLLNADNKMVGLAPAYDLVATRLLIPEKDDPEEMALTLNGKKARLRQSDFLTFGATIGLGARQIENSLRRFKGFLPKTPELLATTFLSDELKGKFEELISERSGRLGII